jgi:thiamine-monophosphate kinase
MGARPVAAFLSLGLPRELTIAKGRRKAWIDGFLDGFLDLAQAFATPLAGGDLAESPIAVADIILVGAVPQGRALLRSGAHTGDVLCVTGALGGSAAGLQALLGQDRLPSRLKSKKVQELSAPHLYPQPRLAQGLWLQRRRLATSAIDMSDGLSTDLAHICEASGVGAEVIAEALPIHSAATLDQALNGGEDYELLFTVAPDARLPKRIAGVAITRIGLIVPAKKHRTPVTLIAAGGSRPLEPKGWEHFS